MGVRLFEYSNLYLEGTGTISTAGGSAYGVGALGHTGLLIDGSISTTGTYAYGIYATDVASLDEQISVLVSGTASISTEGANAHAIYLGDYGSLTLEDGSKVESTSTSTSGVDVAYGIYARDNTTIDSAADVTTSALLSDGIHLDGTGNSLTNSGTITTGGAYASGISTRRMAPARPTTPSRSPRGARSLPQARRALV